MSEAQRIQLHPLVVMNIADHLTRARYRQTDPKKPGHRVIGVILGRQDGRTLEIMNSIELSFEETNPADAQVTQITINEEFATKRITAYKTMFPELEAVGWYSVKGQSGPDQAFDQPTAADLEVMKN